MGFTKDASTYYATQVADPTRRIQVEVGDAKQAVFYPQFKTLHWDNETNFSLRYVDTTGETPTVTTSPDGNKVLYSTTSVDIRFYAQAGDEDGQFEFDLRLKTPPPSKALTFTIRSKDFNFFYQAALTDEEIAAGCVRPANVVGSYAVYHTTKANNGKTKHYRTGKAFHLYRPDATDALGTRTWCDLAIDDVNGLLTITIPQAFLDAAVYPILIDPTFGYTTAGASTINFGNTQAKIGGMSSPLTAGTADTVTSYSVYGASTGATDTILAAAYTIVSAVPAARLAVGTSIDVTSSAGWRTSSTVSQALTASTDYCVAVGFGSLTSTFDIYYDDGAAPGRIQSNSVAITDPFDVLAGDSGRHYSFYATYESVPPEAALTGTVTSTIADADIVAGGKTIILTLTGDTYVVTAGTPAFDVGTTKGTTAADSAGGGGGTSNDGNLTCTFPSGYTPTAGDFALMILYCDQGSGSVPTNWSEVTGSPFGAGTEKLQIFYKILAGGESAPVTTISGSGVGFSNCANMAIYNGVGSIGAIGTASNGTGTPMTANAITTTADNSIVCGCCGRGDNEAASGQTFGGSSTGVTEQLDGGTAAGNDSEVSMYDKVIATSGSSSGNGSATTSVTDPWVSVLIELVRTTPFVDARAAFRDGLVSAQSEGTGWNARRNTILPLANIVRTSDTVVTATLAADGGYAITAQETIEDTIPASILSGGAAIVATPTFTIDAGGSSPVITDWFDPQRPMYPDHHRTTSLIPSGSIPGRGI